KVVCVLFLCLLILMRCFDTIGGRIFMSQLVVDPKRYVVNYLGVKNSSDLEIALEIYLADKVFDPKFLSGITFDIEDKFERVLDMYNQVNPEGLSGIYYFNFLDYSIESGLIEEDYFDDLSVHTAETILRNSKLKSTIASNILKTNDFYMEVHCEKLEIVEDEDVSE